MLTKNVRRSNTELLPMELKEVFSTNPRGVLSNKEVGGGLDLTSSLEAKFGVMPGQIHKIRGKMWEVLSPKDAKFWKKSQFWGHI